MTKSIYAQLKAVAIPGRLLVDSPRHWNNGLLRYKDKLWMAYRFHRKVADSRCGVAMVQLNPKLLPTSKGQMLDLDAPSNSEHHEDARLFIFRGEPYISYTEMSGYIPGRDYSCVMKYARLRLRRGKWEVLETFQPRYGFNNGLHKEKNWIFFERDGALFCIYRSAGNHVVVQVEGERIVKEFYSDSPFWEWGDIRGGTPPVDLGDGNMLAIFHSSVPTEIAPHFVRYHAGAYTFKSAPPFEVTSISSHPVLTGSEEDGHKVDPRYVAGWKPYVVFPCGLVDDEDGFLVSFGVNDWQCAIGRLRREDLHLGSVRGTEMPPRFFSTSNPGFPVATLMGPGYDMRPVFTDWEVFSTGTGHGGPAPGYMRTTSARIAHDIAGAEGVREISGTEYEAAKTNSSNIRQSRSFVRFGRPI